MKYLITLAVLLLVPLQARADLLEVLGIVAVAIALGPPGWLIAGVGTVGGITAVGASLMIGMAAYGQYKQDELRRQMDAAERDARDAYNASLTDRNITSITSEAPFIYAYGRTRIGCAVQAMFSSGSRDEFKHIIAVHASHECDGIEEIYIGGKALGALDADGFAVNSPDYAKQIQTTQDNSGTSWTIDAAYVAGTVTVALITENLTMEGGPTGIGYALTPVSFTQVGNTITVAASGGYRTTYKYARSTVRVKVHLGAPGEAADADLIAECPTKWTAASKLSGHCYTYVRLDQNQQEFQAGLMGIEVLVRGKKLFDPRTSTTYWSQDNALVLRDYLFSEMCAEVEVEDVPEADIIAAADICDEVVSKPGGGTAARYTFNGTVTADQDPPNVISQMAQSMAGGINSTTYEMWAGKYVAPAFTLEQTDIVGSVAVMPGLSRKAIYNGVKARFIGAENSYVATDMVPYVNATYLAADGEDLAASLEYPFTDETWRCHNLARIYVEDLRNGFTIKATFSAKAWDTKIGQRIWLNSSFFGWSPKVVRITGKTYGTTGTVELMLKEDAPEIWDMADAVVLDATPNTGLASPYDIAAPGSLVLTSGDDVLLKQSDGTIQSRIKAVWPPSTSIYASVAEIQDKLFADTDWKTVVTTDATAGVAFISPVSDNASYDTRIRFVNPYLQTASLWTYGITHQVIGKSAPPSDVGAITATIQSLGVDLSWPAIPDVDVGGYEIRVGGSDWASATFVAKVSVNAYLWKIQDLGAYVIRIKAFDTSKGTTGEPNYSVNAASATVTISAAAAPSVSYLTAGPDEMLLWTEPASSFLIDHYEIRYGGSDWASATPAGTTKANNLRRKADYLGARTYRVAAVDIKRNVGTAGNIDVIISAPGPVLNAHIDVIDNNVLIYWEPPNTGSLPVAYYDVRKGATYESGTPIGSNGNSTFTPWSENTSGTYTYQIAAVDSAGNVGTPTSKSVYVNQPPDYVLRANIDSDLSGTLVNAKLYEGVIVWPINTTETWSEHFANHGWATPQDQIDAGYPLYIEPGLASASYSEIIDYGSVLPSTTIVVTPDTTAIAGAVSLAVQIDYKLNSGDGWTAAPAGDTVLVTNFRYVRFTITATATAGANLQQLNGVNIRLSAKQRGDGGAGVSAVAGTAITFSYPFLSADTPQIQAAGFDAYDKAFLPVVDYTAVPNPTGATVYILDSTGTKVNGVVFSWTVKGY